MQYNIELFAQQIPYLQWLREQKKDIKETYQIYNSEEFTGKHIYKLPFSSCMDKVKDILELVNIDITSLKENDICIFAGKDGVLDEYAYDIIDTYFREHKDAKIVYADEDYYGDLQDLHNVDERKVSDSIIELYREDNGCYRGEPWFKPEFSPDTISGFFYFGKIFALHGRVIKDLVCDENIQNMTLYDLVLLAVEDVDGANYIHHIPKVLFTNDSTQDLNKLDGFNCIKNNKRNLEKEPRISVVIPSKDNSKILKVCIDSLVENTKYSNYEIIIVDNGSSDSEQMCIKDEIICNVKKIKSNIEIKYIYDKQEFNFSKMCNIGAVNARGEYLLFLNDDIEILPNNVDLNRMSDGIGILDEECVKGQNDWLEVMVNQAAKPYAGAVGAKLYYPKSQNDKYYRIQHVGITNMGIGPAHKLCGLYDNENIYHGRNIVNYNVMAVTAACMMVSKEKFNSVDGFDEKLAVAYNDVELCFKLYEKGFYNIVMNDVTLIHHESLSRGHDITSEKEKRLEKERRYLYMLHPNLAAQDPFYSPNLVQWEKDILYNCSYLYDYDKVQSVYKLTTEDIKKLPKSHANKVVRRLTGENLIMTSLDEIKVIYMPENYNNNMLSTMDISKKCGMINGWALIREKDNSLVQKKILLRSCANNDESSIYMLESFPCIRLDVEKIFENTQTKNVSLAGIHVLFNAEGIEHQKYEIGLLIENGNKKYISWSDKYISI